MLYASYYMEKNVNLFECVLLNYYAEPYWVVSPTQI